MTYLLKRDDFFNLFFGGLDEAKSKNVMTPRELVWANSIKERFKGWDKCILPLLDNVDAPPRWSLVRLSDVDYWTHES